MSGLPYFNPHSFRKTIWKLGEKVCANGAEAKAWSLNLGHENVTTSFSSYGPMTSNERETVMGTLASRIAGKAIAALSGGNVPSPEAITQVLAYLQRTAS